MKKFSVILLIGICLSTFSSFTVPNVPEKIAGNTTNEIIPFSTVINACGEDISIEGQFHIVINFTESANGNTHNKYHINAKGKGVGLTSGAKYQWNDSINETLNLTKEGSGCCGNQTAIQRWRIIGQGKAPDFFLNSITHITANANGEITVDIDDFSVECK